MASASRRSHTDSRWQTQGTPFAESVSEVFYAARHHPWRRPASRGCEATSKRSPPRAGGRRFFGQSLVSSFLVVVGHIVRGKPVKECLDEFPYFADYGGKCLPAGPSRSCKRGCASSRCPRTDTLR